MHINHCIMKINTIIRDWKRLHTLLVLTSWIICCQPDNMVIPQSLMAAVYGHGPLIRYAKLRVAHAPGMPGTLSRHRLQRKALVSDPGMHHGTCVTHVPWCMSGSLTRVGGENVPGIPGACATRNFSYLVRGPWRYYRIISPLQRCPVMSCQSPSQWSFCVPIEYSVNSLI